MKKILIFIYILGATLVSNAQLKQEIKRANLYFDRAFYSEAIPLYQSISKKDRSYEVLKNLGDSYYYTNNMGRAARVYKYIINNYSNKAADEYYFKYAHTLKALGDYTESDQIIRAYYEQKGNDEELSTFERTVNYLENVRALGDRYSIENLGINTEHSEFGAIQHGEKLVFSASKKASTLFDKLYKWDSENYLDLYEVPMGNIHSSDSISESLKGDINTKLHEANASFSGDGNTVYFTRNNYKKGKRTTDDKNITHLQIYRASLIEGQWKEITSLHFNADNYSNEHPALSPDGKTLYFASDMPGGYGSFDIYSVKINNDGSFGTPQNLGPEINTDKKEQFPFVTEDNKLYFSSDGHPGFGLLDVFVSTITNSEYSKPDNIGLPINSGYDDFSFTIDTETKEGFFASNRPGGKGNDDIYQIVEKKPLVIEDCKQFISGVITDEDTDEIIPFASLILTDNKNNELEKITADAQGKFGFGAQCETGYIVLASKPGFTNNKKVLILQKERNKNNDASMTLKSLAQLAKEQALAFEQERIKKEKQRVEAEAQLEKDKKERTEKAINDEKDIVKEKDRIVIKTDEINFDYNLWYLRRDAKKVINRVINLMKKYPDMIVEVGTHTDIRGNNKYNLELSEKRANSVRMYFMENDIEPDRISAIGYGETKPLVYCETEEACSEEQHELNRRCEFVIKGF